MPKDDIKFTARQIAGGVFVNVPEGDEEIRLQLQSDDGVILDLFFSRDLGYNIIESIKQTLDSASRR